MVEQRDLRLIVIQSSLRIQCVLTSRCLAALSVSTQHPTQSSFSLGLLKKGDLDRLPHMFKNSLNHITSIRPMAMAMNLLTGF